MNFYLKKISFAALLLIGIVSLAHSSVNSDGTISGGTPITRPDESTFKLGKTIEEITAQYGEPSEIKTSVVHGRKIQRYNYLSGLGLIGKPRQGKIGVEVYLRGAGFYFDESKLIGVVYFSNIDYDSTEFDASKIEQIQQGVHTRDDVVKLLGAPSGELTYPMTPDINQRIISYQSINMDDPANPNVKMALILLDANGTVIGVWNRVSSKEDLTNAKEI